MHTKNCIVCQKPATKWTGHIHTEIGKIISGWCNEHHHSNRPRSNKCTSTNPHSCDGEYKLTEIELIEELTQNNLLKHKRKEQLSELVDSRCSTYHPNNKLTTFAALNEVASGAILVFAIICFTLLIIITHCINVT